MARCTADSDCSGHLLCLVSEKGDPSCNQDDVFACGPLCRTDADCPPNSAGPAHCVQGNCNEAGPVCGRPFLVAGAARVASHESRIDFLDVTTPYVATLSSPARRVLAEHYTAVALMEHASVAAFARFVLELLSAGAPSELVEAAGEAMRDELRHTRLCFGLASAYAGVQRGPGSLDTTGAFEPVSFEERLRTAFLEACVGETVAAFEVAEAAARATDPVVASVLGEIAADEMRHAALGFRFVRWALGTLSPERRAGTVVELLGAMERQRPGSRGRVIPCSDEPSLRAHGLLPRDVLREVRASAFDEVVVPCTLAALGDHGVA